MSTGQGNVVRVLLERVENLRNDKKTADALRVSHTAVESARRAAEQSEENLPELITALEVSGDLSREAGDYPTAEGYYIEALGWAESCEVSPAQRGSLKSSLGGVYDLAGIPESAIPLMEEAIDLFRRADPPMETDIGNLRNNLGMLYKDAGNFDKGEENYVKALEIFERCIGRESEDVAAVYNNLGGLYYAAGYSAQAREMHSQALEIRLKVHEPLHPDVAQSYSNLATVLHELGEDEEAVHHYETALRILESRVSSDGDTYAIVSDNFVALLRDLGRERKAQGVEKRAHKLLRRSTVAAG